MEVAERSESDVTFAPAIVEIDERAARSTLRGQIARLESELSNSLEAAGAAPRPTRAPPSQGAVPRVLGLGELELVRDELAARLTVMRALGSERAEQQSQARLKLERMLLDPAGHPFERVSAAELGQQSCAVYESRPRLGLVGMLMGWWEVKVSSGCPPARGPWLAP